MATAASWCQLTTAGLDLGRWPERPHHVTSDQRPDIASPTWETAAAVQRFYTPAPVAQLKIKKDDFIPTMVILN